MDLEDDLKIETRRSTVTSDGPNYVKFNAINRRKGFQRRDTRTSFIMRETAGAINQFMKIQKSVNTQQIRYPKG